MLRREAASWLARLQSARDPDVRRRFERWRDTHPTHAAAFDRVQKSYEKAGLLRHSELVVSGPVEPRVRTPKWAPMPALAAAAVLILLLPAGMLLLRSPGVSFGGTRTLMLMTAVGQIREVDLTDGSQVTLDSATKIEVEIGRSHRSARLTYGRARFRIASSRDPFVVETAKARISLSRGVVDVENYSSPDRVHVLTGLADVRALGNGPVLPVQVAAGRSVTIASGRAEPDNSQLSSSDWTRGMLQFDGTPLADAVALANRYSQRHILLSPSIEALRVTGAFRAGDTAGFAQALAAAFDLSLTQGENSAFILSRRASAAAPKKTGG